MPQELPRRCWTGAFSFAAWFRTRRLKRHAKRIAAEIFPELWENSRRKLNTSSSSTAELTAYAQVRAGQLSQLRVDELVRKNEVSAETANVLIVSAAEAATRMIINAAGAARRAAA